MAPNLTQMFNKDVQYIVPVYQRKYAWNDVQWDALWDVVSSSVDDETNRSHFMGMVVLVKKDDPSAPDFEVYEIVDGQQRLMTLQILMRALRRGISKRMGNNRISKHLDSLIQNKESSTENSPQYTFVLRPSLHDREAFDAISVKNDNDIHSDHKITKAYCFFCNKVDTWLDEDQSVMEKQAKRVCDQIKKVFYFVKFIIDDDHKYEIFECLNSLGTPLLHSDLAKTFLVDMIHQKEGVKIPTEDLIQEKWIIEGKWWEKVISKYRRTRSEHFLYNWITAINGPIPSNRIFESFKEMYYDLYEDNPYKLVEDMRKFANQFIELMDNDKFPEDVGSTIYQIRQMGNHSMLPLLLSIPMCDIRDKDGVGGIITAVMIRRLVSDLNSKPLEKMCREILQECIGADVDIKGEIIKYLNDLNNPSNLIPSRTQIEKGFMRKSWKENSHPQARMLLEAFEVYLRHKHSAVKEYDWDNLTIEHIIPKKWSDVEWPLEKGDDEERRRRNERVYLLANLTLLTKGHNPFLSNKAWSVKRGSLGNSDLNLNREILKRWKYTKWRDSNIESRSKDMAKWVEDIWPIPKE